MDFDLNTLRNGLLFYIILVCSLCIHEWAHAFVADLLGDDTPRHFGRVTLNPVAHMDLFGTVIFPLVCIFFLGGGFLFGWGKPVPMNSSNFHNRRRDETLATLAGPVSNLLVAALAAVVGGLLYKRDPKTAELFMLIIGLNVTLAVFNLIPLPPLDGGTVLKHAIRMSEETFLRISQWSFIILMAVLWLPPLRWVIVSAMGLTASPFILIYQWLAGG